MVIFKHECSIVDNVEGKLNVHILKHIYYTYINVISNEKNILVLL